MPKLLWISQFNLHDSSSGAAKHCKALLEQIAKRGVEVIAVGGFVFDNLSGAKSTFPKLEDEVQKDASKKPLIQLEQNGIKYFYVPTSTTKLSELTHDEEWRIYVVFCKMLNQFCPDVCMGYGMSLFGTAVHAECRRRGIPHAYPICNGNHPYYNFYDSDLIFTDSAANAALYAKRDRLNLATTGAFINKDDYISTEGSHEYITMINPEPRKGGSILAKIALLAQSDAQLKNEKFLVVNSRGNFPTTVALLHDGDDKEARNYNPAMFANVQMCENTNNMKAIYAMTKLLIAPSVPKAWHEGWGRVASEAVLNRIPALVAKNGGLEEAMAGAGIALDVPAALHDDPARMPSDEEIKPWMDALKKLLKDSREGKMEAAFDKAAKLLDIERSTDRTMAMLEPLFARRASQNPHIIISGQLRFDKDGEPY